MVGRGRHLCNRGKDLERPVAAVYRGPIACDGCSESVAELLRKSPANFRVHYLGPTETHDINAQTLNHLDLFAWPGGGDDQDADYLKVAHYTKEIQEFVRNGGRYAGFCMGAFLAQGQGSNQTFFQLLPRGSYVSSERFEKGAQIKGDEDTIILTDWTFHTGPKRGTSEDNRWQYFQDGGQIHLDESTLPVGAFVLGRYTYTGDPCSVIVPYGAGYVGLVGVHPEADKSWYEDWHGHNPQGIKFDIGHDFVQSLWQAEHIIEGELAHKMGESSKTTTLSVDASQQTRT
ncbi:hypothetical protein FA10DRAFT_89483 [Acaromyces ingoldii]|uniref:Biotin-protein ligase N-terminal domain-containing protein n=1 Tax=Acaromyces ingoldii TaxID=215250 RepID=A0A316YTC7_9BASI|nr:hypothetical protein FA10DRAFT_89483 [Acaromyces ingoldii]PWN92296.1 hypothetical protein FA10DRAFT_89483 [Acaromyces ingoldii]